MASSVFFKFKSQKEPSRVTFDGTGISVFELKRQIITINRLGDGTDFDVAIYNQDTNEEYDDDTTIIPRSTSIIARRLPPTRPGRGTAQRYVSGKMPTSALPNAGRREKNFGNGATAPKKPESASSGGSNIPGLVTGGGDTEEDKIAAMFQATSEQWHKTQEQMANATPIHRGGPGFKKSNAPTPAHPPPNGYICYRCGEKGHWIQQCPTNADPNFDGRPRVKRTTGIPRSFLKTVEKPPPISADDDSTSHSNPTSVMVNADGEYVVAQPDQASWESYQKKAATTVKAAEIIGNKELQERGIECPMCHKLMRDATQTPCCGRLYCEECIQNALLESDFVCPSCEAKDILLDSLVVDSETRAKVDEYLKSKETKVKEKSKSPVPQAPSAPPKHVGNIKESATPVPNTSLMTIASTPVPVNVSRKRPAEDQLEPQIPRGPAAMRASVQYQHSPQPPHHQHHQQPQNNGYNKNSQMYNPQPFHQQFPQQQYMSGYNQYPMSMNNGMNMNGNYYNPHHGSGTGPGQFMNGPNGMMGGMNGGMPGMTDGNMMGMGHMNGTMGVNGSMGMNGMGMNGMGMGMGCHGIGPMNGMTGGMGVMNDAMRPMFPAQHFDQRQQDPRHAKFGHFPNQQRTVFSEPFPSEEDSPYMRKPVNPHRHLRPKRIRPSDFKALGE